MDRDRAGGGGLGHALAGCLLLAGAVAVRALPWPSVMRADGVYPNGSDAYYHLRRIAYTVVQFPEFLARDRYVNFPDGGEPIWTPVFDWVLAALARLVVGPHDLAGLERLGMWVPPLLGAATVATLYVVARRHFSSGPALAAGIALCVLPAHFTFSQIGFLDHHAAVAWATTWLLAAGMALFGEAPTAARPGPSALRRAIVVGVAGAVALLLWPGCLLQVAIVQAALALRAIAASSRAEAVAWGRLGALAQVVAAVVVAPLSLGRNWEVWGSATPVVLSNFQPVWLASGAIVFALVAELWVRGWLADGGPARAAAGAAATVAAAGLAFVLLPDLRGGVVDAWDWLTRGEEFQARVAESLPLFGAAGRGAAPPEVLLSYAVYGLPLFLLLLLGSEGARRGDRRFLLGWTAALFGATLLQRRFVNALSPAYCLVLAWAGFELWRWARQRLGRASLASGIVVSLTAVCAFPMWRPYAVHAANGVRVANGEPIRLQALARRHAALVPLARWMRDHTPETAGYFDADATPAYGVLGAWGDGHVVRYVARRPVVQDNFGDDVGRENFARAEAYFSSPSEARALEILERLRVRYVLVRAAGSGHSPGYGDDSILTALHRRRGSAETRGPDGARPVSDTALGHHRLVFESAPRAGSASNAAAHYRLFEVVKGARVRGRAPAGALVAAELPMRVEEAGRFVFRAAARADASGRYVLTLPYPNEAFSPALRSAPRYRLSSGGEDAALFVREQDVRNGSTLVGPDWSS